MTRVFGRRVRSGDPFVAALEEWLDQGPEYAAVACNVMCDDRVSRGRERTLRQFFERSVYGSSGSRLEDALRSYKEQCVRGPRVPRFLDLENAGNVVTLDPSDKPLDLVTVLDLNGMDGVFRIGERRRLPLFVDYATEISERQKSRSRSRDRALLEWLDVRLRGKTPALQKVVIDQVLTATYPSAGERRKPGAMVYHHPAWATRWDEFSRLARLGPTRWASALGLPNLRGVDRWLVLLRYRLPPGMLLLRPTVLDAGFFAYHFPSPVQVPSDEGGHPADLRGRPTARRLLPEFIHEQLIFSGGAGHLTEFRLGRTEAAREEVGDFAGRRRAHHRLLRRRYGREVVLRWMPRWV